jgi:hypothetical protein
MINDLEIEEQKRILHNEQNKKYRAKNATKINKDKMIYRENHQEQIKKYGKQYYEENKTEVIEKSKLYYQLNKDTIKTKSCESVQCPCGGSYTCSHKSKHFKTKKHQEHIKNELKNLI